MKSLDPTFLLRFIYWDITWSYGNHDCLAIVFGMNHLVQLRHWLSQHHSHFLFKRLCIMEILITK